MESNVEVCRVLQSPRFKVNAVTSERPICVVSCPSCHRVAQSIKFQVNESQQNEFHFMDLGMLVRNNSDQPLPLLKIHTRLPHTSIAVKSSNLVMQSVTRSPLHPWSLLVAKKKFQDLHLFGGVAGRVRPRVWLGLVWVIVRATRRAGCLSVRRLASCSVKIHANGSCVYSSVSPRSGFLSPFVACVSERHGRTGSIRPSSHHCGVHVRPCNRCATNVLNNWQPQNKQLYSVQHAYKQRVSHRY